AFSESAVFSALDRAGPTVIPYAGGPHAVPKREKLFGRANKRVAGRIYIASANSFPPGSTAPHAPFEGRERCCVPMEQKEKIMRDQIERGMPGTTRRGLLKCMLSGAAGGVLWTVSGGVPRGFQLGGDALAATPPASGDFS